MTTPRYLSVATYQQWTRDEATVDIALVEPAINAAELAIDNALGRRMIVSSASSDRVYAPHECSSILRIHDATEVTAIVENSVTLVSGTDYQLEPLNLISAAGETWPYFKVRKLSGTWYSQCGKATVTVTAKWGWSAIPFEVIEACKVITSDMLSNRAMRNGLVAITEVGGVGSRENDIVRGMIDRYRRVESWGIA